MDNEQRNTALLLEQRRRWHQGAPVRVEAYLENYPGLAADAEGLLDLIYSEIDLRQQRGDLPRLDEYLKRFPAFADQLRIQFEVHQAIHDNPPTQRINGGGVLSLAGLRPPAQSGEAQPPRIPGFEILNEVGRGGMGIVYRARQTELKRLVALKVILGGRHVGREERARFRIEAEAAARLQHPNIVQIHAIGEHDGVPYLALEFVDGDSLENLLAGRPQHADQAAPVVETLARAIHHAHQHGIIHRDLKPANVLLRSKSEIRNPKSEGSTKSEARTSDCEVKVTDFGLAKLLDSDQAQTSSGTCLGTPCYMAPEQAGGEPEAIGPATDVYALGTILYQMLTGAPPFQGKTAMDTLEQVRSQEPIPPARVQNGVPRDLQTICLKCLAKEPNRRYGSALELAEDLRRYRTGEPIMARPVSRWERTRKWVQRKPAYAALLGLATLVAAMLPALGWWHHQDVLHGEAQTRALEAAQRADAQEVYRQFMRHRDEAWFQGICGDSPEAFRTSVQHAFSLLHTAIDSDAAPRLHPYWTDAEQKGITSSYHQLLMLLGDKRAARPEQYDSASLEPAGSVAYFLLGRQHYDKKEFGAAREDFEKALVLEPRDFWSRFYLAFCFLGLGQPRNAEAHLTTCIQERPGFVWTYLIRSHILEQQKKVEAADADFRTMLALDPSMSARYKLFIYRARMRLEHGQTKRAAVDLQQAIQLRPNFYEAYVCLALVCEQEQNFEAADRWLDQAVRRQPPDAEFAAYQVHRAARLYRLEQYARSLQAADSALSLAPGSREAVGCRGLALVHLARPEQAIQAFDLCLQRGGQRFPNVFRGRALARMQRGEYLAAVDDASRLLELQRDSGTLALRGWAYFFADAWKLALSDFATALQLDAHNTDATIGQGLAQVMLGRYPEAVADAESALCAGPDKPEMLHNIACIFALAATRVQATPSEGNRETLASGYRQRATQSLRQLLNLLPASDRLAYWQKKVVTDTALTAIRGDPDFQQLEAEFFRSGK